MKIYVAAKFENAPEVKTYYEAFIKAGHTITVDWTIHESIKPYDKNPEKAKEFAIEDTNGVLDADVFVQITHPEGGRGMFVELGLALGSFLKTGQPKIYVVGEYKRTSTFYFHPAMTWVASLPDLMTKL